MTVLLVWAALIALMLLAPGIPARAAEEKRAVTAGATNVTAGTTTASVSAPAVLSGATTVRFAYGRTTDYGERTGSKSFSSSFSARFLATLTGLEPGTEYHVRLEIQTAQGRVNGPDTLFVTEPAVVPDPPVTAPAEPPVTDPPAVEPPATDPVVEPAPEPVTPPAPEQGTAVVAAVGSGEVRVKTPGGTYEALSASTSVPVGSIVDARQGSLKLSSETTSGTQTGEFGGAVFQVRQDRTGKGMTELHLKGGSFAACRRPGRAAARAAGKRRKPVRKLWGKDKGGRFRTHGRESVATVRGTAWTVADRCDGTVTRVSEGAVMVRDRHTGRRTLVRAGERHFAAHR
jgi:outer membrane biosynthesis protein TonB